MPWKILKVNLFSKFVGRQVPRHRDMFIWFIWAPSLWKICVCFPGASCFPLLSKATTAGSRQDWHLATIGFFWCFDFAMVFHGCKLNFQGLYVAIQEIKIAFRCCSFLASHGRDCDSGGVGFVLWIPIRGLGWCDGYMLVDAAMPSCIQGGQTHRGKSVIRNGFAGQSCSGRGAQPPRHFDRASHTRDAGLLQGGW